MIQRCSHCLTAVVLLGDLSMVRQPHLQAERGAAGATPGAAPRASSLPHAPLSQQGPSLRERPHGGRFRSRQGPRRAPALGSSGMPRGRSVTRSAAPRDDALRLAEGKPRARGHGRPTAAPLTWCRPCTPPWGGRPGAASAGGRFWAGPAPCRAGQAEEVRISHTRPHTRPAPHVYKRAHGRHAHTHGAEPSPRRACGTRPPRQSCGQCARGCAPAPPTPGRCRAPRTAPRTCWQETPQQGRPAAGWAGWSHSYETCLKVSKTQDQKPLVRTSPFTVFSEAQTQGTQCQEGLQAGRNARPKEQALRGGRLSVPTTGCAQDGTCRSGQMAAWP